MIQQIKLVQIKDIYVGQVDILRPLIERMRIHGFPLEVVPVKKSTEWMIEYQVYEPLPDFAYLIAAAKLALPLIEVQMGYVLPTYEVVEDFEQWSKSETETLLESNRIKLLLKNGDVIVYREKVTEYQKKLNDLRMFSELIDNAEVEQ